RRGERVLERLGGVVLVAQDLVGQPVHLVAVAHHQLVECARVALLRLAHQHIVGEIAVAMRGPFAHRRAPVTAPAAAGSWAGMDEPEVAPVMDASRRNTISPSSSVSSTRAS